MLGAVMQRVGNFGYFPTLPSARQMLRNARVVAVFAVALVAFNELAVAYADRCEDNERVCVRFCLDGRDGRESGACLLGCKLAWLFCKWFAR